MARLRYSVPALVLCFCAQLFAQQVVVRRDTQIPVELRTTVKTDSAKPGMKVEFRTTEAVLIGNNIVVPDDTKILGTVASVQRDAPDSPHSLLRIRIESMQWKKGSARLNAVVSSVEASPAQQMLSIHRRRALVEPPNFMKGIRIRAHLKHDAYTEFLSEQKDFVLRSGISLVLRQLDPDRDPEMMTKEPLFDVSPPR